MKNSNYLSVTNSPLYSFIFTIPLFLIYEIGVFTISVNDIVILRNGADVLMRQVLGLFGIYGVYGFSASFMIGFMVAFLRQKKSLETTVIKGEYLIWMFFESICWGVLLFILMGFTAPFLIANSTGTMLQQVVLSIGAGIYEEFVFRVIFIAGFGSILGFIFQWKKFAKITCGIILSAALFSLFHFMGDYGEEPNFSVFMMRFIAGIFLGFIYVFRGFGPAAYAHTVYDLIILTIVTTQL
jgi:membrane protease YdiL (CAAX protease family)